MPFARLRRFGGTAAGAADCAPIRSAYCMVEHGSAVRGSHDRGDNDRKVLSSPHMGSNPNCLRSRAGCVKTCQFFTLLKNLLRSPLFRLAGTAISFRLCRWKDTARKRSRPFLRDRSQKPSRSFSRLILTPPVRYRNGANESYAHLRFK